MKRLLCAVLAVGLVAAVAGGCKKKEEQKPADSAAKAISEGLGAAGKAVSDAGKAVSDAGKQ